MPFIFERLAGMESGDPEKVVVLYASLRGDAIVPVTDRMQAWACPLDDRAEAEAEILRLDPETHWMSFPVGRSAPPKSPKEPPMPGRHLGARAKLDWLTQWQAEHEEPRE